MKHLKTRNQLNESSENLNISDVSFSFSIEPLFDDEFNDKKVMSKISWFKNEIKERYKNVFIPLSMNWSSECRNYRW